MPHAIGDVNIDGPAVFGNLAFMRESVSSLMLACGAAAFLAACGAGNAVTTGSLFGGPKDAPPPVVEAKPVTQADRLAQVAAVSARAQRCSFFFDPEQLKASYLASEQQAGTPPEQMPKLTQDYDSLRGKVSAAIGRDEGYCTEGRAREIKASLTRHLAGDFNPPVQKAQSAGGTFLDTAGQGKGREVFVPSEVFNPQRKGVTRRAEE